MQKSENCVKSGGGGGNKKLQLYQDSFHQQMHPFIKHIKC